jgi:outer membrane protein
MNYKFLSALTLAACMYTSVKANTTVVVKQPEATKSVLKIGYVDVGYILENLPEAKKLSAEIQSFQKQLENEIQAKYKEYQEKMETAQQQLDTLTEAQKKQKTIEFSKLQASIEELESQRYPKMEQRYKEVMKPLHDCVQEVIAKIAEEHNYTFVLNKNSETGPILLFAASAFDLSELVVEKLKSEVVKKEVKTPVIGPKNNVTTKAPAKEPTKNPPVVKKK